MKQWHISVVLICYFCSAFCLEEGEPCVDESSGKSGTCTHILKCPGVTELIQAGTLVQPCTFIGTVPIVCCVGVGDSNSIPRTETETTTTGKAQTRRNEVTVPPALIPPKPNAVGYKSYQKCLEYSELVFTYDKPPILFIDKEEEKINTCGFEVIPLIIGGQLADRREFPHMVRIGYESAEGIQWGCGGTLITERFVLTASHCFFSRQHGNAKHARMGVTQIDDTNNRQDRLIVEHIRHPNYDSPSYYNDIGLLKLDKNVDFDIYVRPACLHFDWANLNEKAVATGWGETNSQFSSDELMKITLDLVDVDVCNESSKRISKSRLEHGIEDTSQLCAGSPGKDTCQGDSGGPLQIYSKIDCMYEIAGVTSFGSKACGKGRLPGVYTRVFHYIEWLEKILWN